MTGYVRTTENPAREKINPALVQNSNDEEVMTSRDIYKELRLRGYHYSGLFRGLKSASSKGSNGRVAWSNNWVAFMDNMLQMQIVGSDTRGLFVPTGLQKLVIDTKSHLNIIRGMDDENRGRRHFDPRKRAHNISFYQFNIPIVYPLSQNSPST